MKNNFLIFLLGLFSASIFGQNNYIKNESGVLYPAGVYYCPGSSYNLNVQDFNSTGSNSTTQENASNYFAAGGSQVEFEPDLNSKFSNPINLGFNFKFYGTVYTRVVVGRNGRLIFSNSAELDQLHDTSTYVDRTYSGRPYSLPQILIGADKSYQKIYKNDLTKEFKSAQIFFGYTDITSNAYTSYTYHSVSDPVEGKGLVITFKDVVEWDGGSNTEGTFTSSIVLFESGKVLINVKNKIHNNYNAIIGMQNEDVTQFLVGYDGSTVPRYNNDKWLSDGTKQFVFTTGSNRIAKYLWEIDKNNDGTIDYSTNFWYYLNYQPTETTERVKFTVSYEGNVAPPETSTIIFNKVKKPVITKAVGDCEVSFSITPDSYDPNLNYRWYKNGAQYGNASGQSIPIKRSDTAGDFYAVAIKPDGTACGTDSQSNTLNFSAERFPNALATVAGFCDNTGNVTKVVNLYSLFYPKYDPSSGLLPYYVDFDLNGAVITDPENFTIPPNVSLAIGFSVRSSPNGSPCVTGGLGLDFISGPPDLPVPVCAGASSYDLSSLFSSKYSGFQIYYTYADDGSTVVDTRTVDPNRDVNVKVLSAGGCSITTKVHFVQSNNIAVPAVPVQQRCKGSDNNAPRFDFNLMKNILDPAGQYVVKFYRKSDNSEIVAGSYRDGSDLSSAGYFWTNRVGDYTIYAKVFSGSCFSTSENIILRTYPKPKVLKNTISLQNCPENQIFNLTQNPSALTDADASIDVKLEYYSESGQLLDAAKIINYDPAAMGYRPYIRIIYNPSCDEVIRFDLQFYPKPTALTNQLKYCNETSFTWEQIKNQIIANPQNYLFYESDGVTPLRKLFDVDKSVNYIIKNTVTGCLSDLQTISFIKKSPVALIKNSSDYTDCDATGDLTDGKTVFDLSQRKADFTADTSASFKYYFDDARKQEITNPTTFINTVPLSQTIFIRVESAAFCSADAELKLIVNTPTKSSTLRLKYDICYGEMISVDAGTGNVDYKWSDGQTGQTAQFSVPGNYSVTMTNGKNCTYTHQFAVSDESQPKITTLNQSNEQIEVLVSGGTPPYTYFFNGISNGSNNILMNPSASQYEIYAVSADGCRGPSKFLYTIFIRNVITPNGDGYNDIWKIANLDKMQNVEIQITDRYGKTVFRSKNENLAWDGTFAGRVLPTAAYWYVAKWHNPGTNRDEVRQGWIMLKNRE